MQVSTEQASRFDFKSYLEQSRGLIEQSLEQFLKSDEPEILWTSMRYSVLSSGKRMRAILCLAAAQTILDLQPISVEDKNQEKARADVNHLVMPCACAIEMIHAMSLIHDDLPCLDNDDFRRGKPTNHKVFGEAIALLAGDALLMQAVDTILRYTPDAVDRSVLIEIVRRLATATGAEGMVGGQVYDLIHTGDKQTLSNIAIEEGEIEIETPGDRRVGNESSAKVCNQINTEVLEKIHRSKTAALISFSLWSGARLAGAFNEQLAGIEKFGSILGLAFQIRDDLLDVTGDRDTLGKTPGKDEATMKATWVRVFGIDGATKKLEELKSEGRLVLQQNQLEAPYFSALPDLLDFAIGRTH